MLKAVLFDLDDTLLANDMDVFLPPYFDALCRYTEAHLERTRFLPALLESTRAMLANPEPAATNREIFWRHFTQLTGLLQSQMEPFFDAFYTGEFERLSTLTSRVEQAADVVESCLQRGLRVVLATNPIFPRTAIEARMRWAALHDVSRWSLITSYEDMCGTKPHPRYYQQIVERLGCAPHEALMVGNDTKNDIDPARAAGLRAFWVRDASQARSTTAKGAPLSDVLGFVAEATSMPMPVHGD